MKNYRGYVYILSNDVMPNIYKIGFTTINPYFRANQLSNSTSCPIPFSVVCFAEFENAKNTEKEIHTHLEDYRINTNKEFFKFSLTDLITYASYILCEPAEYGCLDSFKTEKYNFFLNEFHKKLEFI